MKTPSSLEKKNPQLRIGQGIDFHQFNSNRKLILGGVEIPYEKGLLGHSDADVLLHALMDSLLGAAGLKDIGHYFPPKDPQYSGISSLILLKKVRELIKEQRYFIVNCDVTIVLEEPKIAPYVDQMKEKISSILEISLDAIGIKATTAEGLGFIGRGEGVFCQAVSLLCKEE